MSKNSQKGFTLVELSIVLVIIGLIVAGVVAGQNLVKQAQLRSIISEQEGIRVALNTFKLEYDAVPGDFLNGSSYWSTACNLLGAGDSVAAECNGDGNKQILMDTSVTATFLGESYMAWKHLELAGLYPGSFVPGAAITGVIGTNIPASKFTGAGITLAYDDGTSDVTAADGAGSGGRDIGGNVILFGGAVASDIANGTIFSTNQVRGIDVKVDDGNPIQGSVRAGGTSAAVGAGGTNCVDSGTVGYNLDSTDAAPCSIAFTF